MKKYFLLFALACLAAGALFAQAGTWNYAWSDDGVIITRYNGNDGAVSIPSRIGALPVIGIGPGAFRNCGIGTVEIPPGITFIGEYAFAENFLAEVAIPPSVAEIGEGAFMDNWLSKVSIAHGVRSIGAKAFVKNTLLNLVNLPVSVRLLADDAFDKWVTIKCNGNFIRVAH